MPHLQKKDDWDWKELRDSKMKDYDIQEVEEDFTGTEIISINGVNNLQDIQSRYPNIEIIFGKATKDDKPVKLNLLEMENDRKEIFDAATESILGKRIDKLEKPVRFPLPGVTFVLGAMAASVVWLYITRFVMGG